MPSARIRGVRPTRDCRSASDVGRWSGPGPSTTGPDQRVPGVMLVLAAASPVLDSEALGEAVEHLVRAQVLGEGAHGRGLVDDRELDVRNRGEILPHL